MKVDDYIAQAPDYIPEQLILVAEASTIAVSLIGAVIALLLTFFFQKSKGGLATRLRCEYFTDFLGFMVLLVMGIGLYCNFAWLVKMDVIVRPFVVCMNIYAMYRLYKYYKGV